MPLLAIFMSSVLQYPYFFSRASSGSRAEKSTKSTGPFLASVMPPDFPAWVLDITAIKPLIIILWRKDWFLKRMDR